MREFLLEYCPVLILLLLPCNLITVQYFARSYQKDRQFITLCMCLITGGLFYDSLILSLGGIYAGGMLAPLSRFRYIFHGALIPLLFSVCAHGLTENRKIRRAVLGISLAATVMGSLGGIFIQLELLDVANLNRYASADSTAAWITNWNMLISYGTVIPLIISGAVIMVKKHTPTLFLGGLLMFGFSALGPATGNFDLIFLITMLGEECMVFFFVLYNRWLTKDRHLPFAAAPSPAV